ncbi:Genome sequencing data, contig C298 [Stanieria sp. NIES-3757]|nr:Genome sequencing data, contig C298 [Stanieria sp. NIES-3757]
MAVSRNWENMRSFLRKAYNREVNEWFKDIADEFPENTTGRANTKRACLILPKESQNSALLKVLNFRFVVQRSHLRPHVYGLPIGSDQAIRKHKPQITLFFKEDMEDIDPDYEAVEGQISYRLMNESSETITKAELTSIANKIKVQFGGGDGDNAFRWDKGKDLASYVEKNKGYQFQLLVRNKTDAKDLVTRVLATNSDVPDWKYLSYKEADEPTSTYPTLPGTQTILGKITREPRIRPIARVRFQYAYCSIWARKQPVILYDRSLTYFDPLVES